MACCALIVVYPQFKSVIGVAQSESVVYLMDVKHQGAPQSRTVDPEGCKAWPGRRSKRTTCISAVFKTAHRTMLVGSHEVGISKMDSETDRQHHN